MGRASQRDPLHLLPCFCYTYEMIHGKKTHRVRRFILTAGLVAGAVAVIGVQNGMIDLPARLLRQAPVYQWYTISKEEVGSGTVIPANTSVIIHLPSNFTSIARETLLGQKGKRTRYWGYCFPENDPPEVVSSRTGFPGLMFLSEKERAVRAAEQAAQSTRFSPSQHLPSDTEVVGMSTNQKPAIRHQMDVFKPDTLCYIMTEASLAIGLDPDGDRLNNKLEAEIGTDPATPDTDADGIMDGVEYLYHTSPFLRDTDDDGIIDGIEDANWNGRVGIDETDPRTKDSDRDNLCDGMCRVKLKNNFYYIGEDKNLNGLVDSGETDPRLWSTQGDGISDEVLFMECLAAGGTDCP